jgi:Tse6 toxin immunity protein Tsi6
MSSDAPALDELPALIDEGLRVVDERLAAVPDARLYDSLKAQLTYVRAVVHGERERDPGADERLLLGRYAAYEFETSDPPFSDVLAKVHYLYDRWPATEGPP